MSVDKRKRSGVRSVLKTTAAAIGSVYLFPFFERCLVLLELFSAGNDCALALKRNNNNNRAVRRIAVCVVAWFCVVRCVSPLGDVGGQASSAFKKS